MSDEVNSGISNKWKLRLAVFAGTVLFCLLFVTGVTSRHFICRDCAHSRTTTQIFGLEFQGDLEDTPFSRELSHLMLDGTHTWILIHRRNLIGFGDTNTHGSWVDNTANSESVVSFIHDVERFEGRENAEKWVALSLDSVRSTARPLARSPQIPKVWFRKAVSLR